MEDKNKHKYDGKEDRNYHQKPFDEVADGLPQIDETSADLAHKAKTGQKPDEAAPEGSQS